MWHKRKFILMGLIPALIFLVGLLAQSILNRSFNRASGYLADSSLTPYTIFEPKINTSPESVAVILHGRRCSSSMMVSLARMMARNGFKTYNLDLYGHGKSSFTLPLQCPEGAYPNFRCRPEQEYISLTSDSLGAIQKREGPQLKKIILIGHSWGGRLGHDLLRNWPLAEIEPFLVNLDGELINPGYSGENLFTVRVGPYQSTENQITLPKNHLSIIQSEEVNESILAWLDKRFALALEKSPGSHFFLNLLVFTALAIFCFWFAEIFSLSRPKDSFSGEKIRSHAFPLILTTVVGGLVQFLISQRMPLYYFFQWQIYLQNIYLFSAGITGWIAGAIFLVWGRKISRPEEFFRPLFLALGFFVFLSATIFWFAEQNIFSLGFSFLRAKKFVAYLVLLLPLCLLLSRISYRYRFGVWIFLLAISTLGAKGIDPKEAASLFLILSFMEIYSERLARVSKSTLAGSFLFCLLLSWWAAAAYPTTTFFTPSLKSHKTFFFLDKPEK